VCGYLWWLRRTVFLHGSGCRGVFFCRVALVVSTLTKLGKPSLTRCKAQIARMQTVGVQRCRRGGHVARCKFVDIGVIVLEHMGSVEVVVRDPDVQSWLGVRCWMWGMSRRFTRLRLSPRGLAFSCDSDFDVAVEIVRQAGLHWYGCQKFCWKAGPLDFVLVLCWCGVRALRCVSSSI